MAATFPESSLLVCVTLPSADNKPTASLLMQFCVCSPHPADPSMTVRTDIKGKYSNRWYAYEPDDMADCE